MKNKVIGRQVIDSTGENINSEKKKMNAALPYPALGSNPSSAAVRLKTLDGPPGLLSLIPIRFSGEQAVAFTGKLQNLFCMTIYIVNHLIRLLLF